MESSDWDWTLGVNFYGALYGVQTFLPHMHEHGEEGHVVLSRLWLVDEGMGTYGVSKHAVRSLSETLNQDLRERLKNFFFRFVPGFVNTNIANSERNRPSSLINPGQRSPRSGSRCGGDVEKWQTANEIAEIVVVQSKTTFFIFYLTRHGTIISELILS